MSLISFRCGSSSGLLDLCFAQSYSNTTCEEAPSGEEYCAKCPPGFGPDNTFGHYGNCALPDVFMPAYFGIHSLASFVAVAAFARAYLCELHKRPAIASVTLSIIASFVVQWITVLCWFLQGGAFEATMAFNAILTVTLGYTSVRVQILLLRPVQAFLKGYLNRMTRNLTIFSTCQVSIIGTSYLVLVGFARNNQVYNAIICIITLVGAFCYVFHGGGMLRSTKMLMQALEHLMDDPPDVEANVQKHTKEKRLLMRLKFLEKAILGFIPGGAVMNLCLGIIPLVLGSFPYQFVLVACMYGNLLWIAPSLLRFVRDSSEGSVSASFNSKTAQLSIINEAASPTSKISLVNEAASPTSSGGW